MAVDKIPDAISSESDVSMVLNTLMYVNDFQGEAGGKNVQGLLKNMSKNYSDYSDEQKASFDCVYKYVYGESFEYDYQKKKAISTFTYAGENSHPDVGSLVYLNHSVNTKGKKDGAVGAAFYSTDSSGNAKDVYVAFRGTGDGRWYDNGDAFSKKYSPYQQDAAEYFDSVMEELPLSDQTNVYVTGHSKGGNQAQFVTLASKYGYLVDKCISMDGEGFSPEAIAYFKSIYGEEFYEEQLQKLYSICGDNDYVNVLGVKVIPEDHTVYIETPVDTSDFSNSHGLVNTDTGTGNLFDYGSGSFYNQTTQQRELALLAKSLSENIMKLPKEDREDICRSIMSILEYSFNKNNEITNGVGLNGETATLEEYESLFFYLDDCIDQLVNTKEGRDFINKLVDDLFDEEAQNEFNDVFDKIVLVVAGPIAAYATHGKGVDIVVFSFERIADKIGDFIDKTEKIKNAFEFCCNVAKSIQKWWKETFDADYQAAQEYLADSSIIQLHTDDLWGLAERLWAINGRLQTLDQRIDDLYWKVKWRDLGKLINADFKIGWSSKLNNCANCLSDTANRFNNVEQQILNMMG